MEGGDPKVGHCEDLFGPLHNNVNILKQCSFSLLQFNSTQ